MTVAAAAPPPRTRVYELWDLAVEVACAEPAAAAVAAAIDARLRPEVGVPARPVELRIELGLAAPGSGGPLGPGRPAYEMREGQISYHADDDLLAGELDGVELRCAPAPGRVRIRAPDYGGRRAYLASHPLLTLALIELLKHRGRFSLHAACLARDGRGVLLAGPSGAGKSTLALALLARGLSFLGDDMVFLQGAAGSIRALGFPDAVGVTARTIAMLPQLRGRAARIPDPGFPKRLIRVEEAFGVVPEASCRPVALIFPEIVRAPTSRLAELDPGEAWLRLVPDVLLTGPRATQAHLSALAALLEQVSCHRLESGPDLARSAELAASLL